MTRSSLFILILLHLAQLSFSQIRDTSWNKEIVLLQNDQFKSAKRILLFESDTFAIYSSHFMVVSYLNQQCKDYGVEEDYELLFKLLDRSKSVDDYLHDIQNNYVLKARLNLTTSWLMQNSGCLIYNKTLKTFECKLFMTGYVRSGQISTSFFTQTNKLVFDLVGVAF